MEVNFELVLELKAQAAETKGKPDSTGKKIFCQCKWSGSLLRWQIGMAVNKIQKKYKLIPSEEGPSSEGRPLRCCVYMNQYMFMP